MAGEVGLLAVEIKRIGWFAGGGSDVCCGIAIVYLSFQNSRVGIDLMFESSRLNFRKWTTSDLPIVGKVLGDPVVMEFSDHGPLTQREQEVWLRDATATSASTELPGFLAIQSKQNMNVIGYVSLLRDLTRVAETDAELGFRLAQSAWGRGYATEACNAMLELAITLASVKRIVAIVDPNNHRSVRVLEKIGMIVEGEIMLTGYDYPDHIYVRQCD